MVELIPTDKLSYIAPIWSCFDSKIVENRLTSGRARSVDILAVQGEFHTLLKLSVDSLTLSLSSLEEILIVIRHFGILTFAVFEVIRLLA